MASRATPAIVGDWPEEIKIGLFENFEGPVRIQETLFKILKASNACLQQGLTIDTTLRKIHFL
jgi:hypothetical protein